LARPDTIEDDFDAHYPVKDKGDAAASPAE